MRINLDDTHVGGFNYELLRALSVQGSGGSEIGECLTVMAAVRDKDTESWAKAWNAMADRVEASAERFLQAGHLVSAREAFWRASTYYHAAVFYLLHDDPRHARLSTRSQESGMRAASLYDAPIEVLRLPFGSSRFPGYFLAGGQGKRPTLLALGGFDSTAEELVHWIGFAAQARGWHCLIFEGPGQWSALRQHPDLLLRPDYEVPVRAVVDYAFRRLKTQK